MISEAMADGARHAGMAAVHMIDTDQAIADASEVLGL